MTIFNKEIITEEDIEKLISEKTEESINLEFKAAGSFDSGSAKKREMGKDVSAFANSAGGILIYGIEEIDHIANAKSFIDGNKFTKEWIENVLHTNIHRKIEGLEIIPIRFEDKFEKTIYVIRIPESNDAPHMAGNKYYKRYNFKAQPMEEYEIRQLYNRTRITRLEIADQLIIKNVSVAGPRNKPKSLAYDLSILDYPLSLIHI